MIKKDYIIFALGMLVGIVATVVYFKDREQKMLEQEAEWCEEVARANRREKNEDDIEETEVLSNDRDAATYYNVVNAMQYGNNKKLVSSVLDHKKEITEYKSDKYVNSPAEMESPPEDIGEPYVITFEQFNEEYDRYDKVTMTYYAGDDTLADEYEGIVDDVNNLVGDALTRFGEGSSDPDIVYVRNDSLEIDYEVIKSEGSYSDIVLGQHKRT